MKKDNMISRLYVFTQKDLWSNHENASLSRVFADSDRIRMSRFMSGPCINNQLLTKAFHTRKQKKGFITKMGAIENHITFLTT